MNRFSTLLTLAIAAALVGCGGSDLSIVPVKGKVTYNGGAWPADGTIVFSPITAAEGYPRRPAIGKFRADGIFEATSFKPGDGLVPGTYSVVVSCYEKQPDSNNPITFETYNLVPKDFKPEDVVVQTTDRSVSVEFDVPKKE